MAKEAQEAGDDGTNDLIVSDIIRTNELQTWFVAEHLVNVPLVKADESASVETESAAAPESKSKSRAASAR